jgi:hypothetical protein
LLIYSVILYYFCHPFSSPVGHRHGSFPFHESSGERKLNLVYPLRAHASSGHIMTIWLVLHASQSIIYCYHAHAHEPSLARSCVHARVSGCLPAATTASWPPLSSYSPFSPARGTDRETGTGVGQREQCAPCRASYKRLPLICRMRTVPVAYSAKF